MLVPNETYVVANFKESQIAHMQPGDKVDIEIDAFDGDVRRRRRHAVARDRRAVLADPARQRDRQLREGRAARAGEDQLGARRRRCAMRPGLSAEVTVHVGD